jgi:hypothetical protein
MHRIRSIKNLHERIAGNTAKRITLLLSLLMVSVPVSALGREAPAAKSDLRWGKPITLFNGKDFTGWKFSDPSLAGSWKVEQGMLVSSGRGSNLLTVRKFGDFQTASRVQLRSQIEQRRIHARSFR